MDGSNGITDEDRISWLEVTGAINRRSHRLEVEELVYRVHRDSDHQVEMAKGLGFL